MTIGSSTALVAMPGHNEEETQDEIKVFKTEGGDGDSSAASHAAAPDIIAEDKNEMVKQVEIENNKAPWAAAAAKSAALARSSGAVPGTSIPKRPSPTGGSLSNGTLGGKAPSSGGGGAFRPTVKAGRSDVSQQGPLSIGTGSILHPQPSTSASVPGQSPIFVSGAAVNGFPGAYTPLANIFPLGWPGQGYTLPATAGSPFNFFLNRLPSAPSGPPPAHKGGSLSVDPRMGATPCSPSFSVSPHFPYPAGLSPGFDNFGPFSALAIQSRFSPAGMPILQAPSPANLSPLHSPSGTPIVPTLPKGPNGFLNNNSMASATANFNMATTMEMFKQAQMGGTNVTLPPSFQMRPLMFSPAGFNSMNPLASMASLRLPQVTTTVTSLATSLATAGANGNAMQRNGGSLRSEMEKKGMMGMGGREEKKEPHVKKPLNAFMIFMKENRAKLMEEKGYKERQSAELNKELGRLWHTLSHEEQQKYYQMAREERQKHMQLYPGWTARDNYAIHKKKKRKKDKSIGGEDSMELKKCRARFGLDQQSKWCKHCRRKKKCLWFREGAQQGNNPGSSEQSPIQVSSTTQGSPSEGVDPSGSVSSHPEESGTRHPLPPCTEDGPPSKAPRLGTSSSVSSPSAVSSTTAKRKAEGKGEEDLTDDVDNDIVSEDDVSDDEDDVISDIGSPLDAALTPPSGPHAGLSEVTTIPMTTLAALPLAADSLSSRPLKVDPRPKPLPATPSLS